MKYPSLVVGFRVKANQFRYQFTHGQLVSEVAEVRSSFLQVLYSMRTVISFHCKF